MIVAVPARERFLRLVQCSQRLQGGRVAIYTSVDSLERESLERESLESLLHTLAPPAAALPTKATHCSRFPFREAVEHICPTA